MWNELFYYICGMEENTQTKTETQGVEVISSLFTSYLNEVINSYPSVYSKDDVIFLLNRIQGELMKQDFTKPSVNMDDLVEKIKDEVTTVIEDYDYDGDIDLSLDGREITIDFDYRDLVDRVKDTIDDTVSNNV